MDVTDPAGRDRCERKNQIWWCIAISPYYRKKLALSDSLTIDVVNTTQH